MDDVYGAYNTNDIGNVTFVSGLVYRGSFP